MGKLFWKPLTSVSEGTSTPGAPIAAVPWEGSFALFMAAPDGGIYAVKAVQGLGWELVPGHHTTPGGPVTALLSGDRFHLFVADDKGGIFTTSGVPYQHNWRPWRSVAEGVSIPGAPIAAVPWEDSFAVFIAATDGGIYAIKAVPGFGWALVPGHHTTPGGSVTAILSGNRIHLFIADDVRGEIFTTSGLPYQAWDQWTSVSEGASLPGAPVTAVPWDAGIALFISDPNGGIYAIKAVPGYGWEYVPGISTKPGAPITAVPWTAGGLFLFAADAGGYIQMTHGTPYAPPWDDWRRIDPSEIGKSTPGAPVAVAPSPAPQTPEFALNLFVANSSGGIYTSLPILQAPTGLHITNTTQYSVDYFNMSLAWTDPVYSGGSKAIRLKVVGDAPPPPPYISGTGHQDIDVPLGTETATFLAVGGVNYTIKATAIGVYESEPSNTVTITIPYVPPPYQHVPFNLTKEVPGSGNVSYAGQYPSLGQDRGWLEAITVPANSGVLALNFLKVGHSTDACYSSDAVVTINAGSTTTKEQLFAIYGLAPGGGFPKFSTDQPIGFVVCALLSPNTPWPNSVQIELTTLPF